MKQQLEKLKEFRVDSTKEQSGLRKALAGLKGLIKNKRPLKSKA